MLSVCAFILGSRSLKNPAQNGKSLLLLSYRYQNKKLHTTDIPAAIPRREQPHGLAPLRRLALEAPLPERRELVVPITPPPRPVAVTPPPRPVP
jgi:hypothetical protein